MNLFQVKFPTQNAYLLRYKVVKPNEFRLFLTIDPDQAEVFDEDDRILVLIKTQFEVEIIPCGSETEPETLSPVQEKLPTSDLAYDWL